MNENRNASPDILRHAVARGLATVFACLAALVPPAAAAAGVQVTNTVFREVEQKAPDGRVVVREVDAKSVAPGENVRFLIAYRNDTAKPADNLVVVNPIPSDLEFRSATPGAEVSVDGGKSFGTLAILVFRPVAGVARAAQAADVTHVRWRIPAAIAPGAGGEVSFSARVK